PLPHEVVPAGGDLAPLDARVGVVVVAVVALLVLVDHSVAADRDLTRIGAGVAVDRVAVVALLARVDDPVPADGAGLGGRRARGGAGGLRVLGHADRGPLRGGGGVGFRTLSHVDARA